MITREQIKALGKQAMDAGQNDIAIVLLSLAATMKLGTTQHLVNVVQPFMDDMMNKADKFFSRK